MTDNKTEHYSFYRKVTEFFTQYLRIPENHYYQMHGVLTTNGAQDCAKYLIESGVFKSKEDMKTEAFKSFNIILPDWVFENKKG